MAIALEQAIALASEPVEAYAIISMHDNIGVVAVGGATPTFRADLPLLNWGGQATFAAGGFSSTIGGWAKHQGQVPGFSTRGDGGTHQLVWPGAAPGQPQLTIDFSVRLDPGYVFGRFGLGSQIQMEIERLGPGGAVEDGIQVTATQDGPLLRAMGPTLWETGVSPASWTVGLYVRRTSEPWPG
jgi:hypothetical protein